MGAVRVFSACYQGPGVGARPMNGRATKQSPPSRAADQAPQGAFVLLARGFSLRAPLNNLAIELCLSGAVSVHIPLWLGQEQIAAGVRAEAVKLALVLGAECVGPHYHIADRIATSDAGIWHTDMESRALTRLAVDL